MAMDIADSEDFPPGQFYRYFENTNSPGPRHVHVFGDFTKKREFEEFLQRQEVGAVILDDTSLIKPRFNTQREEPIFHSWLALLRRCTSGQYELTAIKRYIFEVTLIAHEFANLMRDEPMFLGEHIMEAFDAGNEKTWVEHFSKSPIRQSPRLIRVPTSKIIYAQMVRRQLEIKDKTRTKPNPMAIELRQAMMDVKDHKIDFQFSDELFDLVRANRYYMFNEVPQESHTFFLTGWGKAYVHNLWHAASQVDADSVAIVLNMDGYLDDVEPLWGTTTEYDVRGVAGTPMRLSPRYKMGVGMMAFMISHFIGRTQGPPTVQKLALFGSMCFTTGTIFTSWMLFKLKRLDRLVVTRGEEYRDAMSLRKEAEYQASVRR